MGARTIRRRDDSARRRRENLTLWKIVAVIAFPTILAVALVAIDMRSDLSELKSTARLDQTGAMPVGWPELKEGHEVSGRVRMIGYMMDGYQPARDGAQVDMFILLPEAGQFLHPAHRIPDQMVEVWPRQPVVFHNRDLVWASGVLNRTIGARGDNKAAYAMTAADVKPAAQRDIVQWFLP